MEIHAPLIFRVTKTPNVHMYQKYEKLNTGILGGLDRNPNH